MLVGGYLNPPVHRPNDQQVTGMVKKLMTAMNFKQFRMKRWMKICIGVVVAVALFFLLLPFGMKYYLTDWLVKNGADQATIEKLRFNPFAVRLTLDGLNVERKGQSTLHNYSMVLNLGLIALFHHDIRVQRAVYRDLYIDLQQYSNGSWRIGSYTVQGEKKETKVKSAKEVSSAWNFLADQIILSNCSIHLQTPKLTVILAVEQAELRNLSTIKGQPAGTFSLKGRLNDSPVAIQLDTVQLVPNLRLAGKVQLSSFQLGELSRLLSHVFSVLAGSLGFDGSLLFTKGEQQGIEFHYDGTIGLDKTAIGSKIFKTGAGNLSWKGRLRYTAPAENPVTIETDGLLSARKFNLKVSQPELVAEASRIDLNGKSTVTMAENILVKNDGSLLLGGVELVQSPYGITEEDLSWKGKIQYDSAHNKKGRVVSADGLLELGEFQVGGGQQAKSFAMGGKKVSWQGVAGFSQKTSGNKSIIDLKGTLQGEQLQSTLADPQLRIGQEQLELKTDSTIGMGENLDIGGQSSLTLQNFSLFEGGNNSPVISCDKLSLPKLEGKGGKTIAIENLSTAGWKAEISGDFPLKIDIPEITMSNIVTDDLATFTMDELDVRKPLVTAAHNDEELARLDTFTVSKISMAKKTKVSAASARLQNFVFLGSPNKSGQEPAGSFNEANLTAINWSGETGLQGDTLNINDLAATIIREKDGNINITGQLSKMKQGSTGKAAEQKPETPAPGTGKKSPGASFELRKIVMAGDSHLHFEDHTLAVPFTSDLAISRLELTGLDSNQPDQKTKIKVHGELEDRAPLEVTGYILPFKEKPAADLKLELKNYPLANLSSYTVQSVGTAMESGQLQLTSSLTLADGNLDMNNAVLLKKLETKTISPKLAKELNNQLPIPLDAALSLLRDNEKNIKLDVPLSGPVSKLKVGISDVLITALSKAIVPAASGYLMYALGPYGALAYVGMKVGEKMLEVKLPPVIFPAGQHTLTQAHIKYLQRIGKILQDRPETDIQLCPRVASWEFMTEEQKASIPGDDIKVNEKDRNKLLELGQQRAEAVQSHLENKYGIDKDRLLICDTEIDTKKKALPAVLLQL